MLRDDLDKIAVKQRLAHVLEVHLERPDEALAVHERVLELDANNEVSLRAMARLHHLAGRWREVIGIWNRQLALSSTAKERAALHYHIGRVHERKLGERDAAVAAYERAMADDALHSSAMRALDRILRRDRQWKQLCAALERRAARWSTRDSRRWCCTRSRRSKSCTCAISRRRRSAMRRCARNIRSTRRRRSRSFTSPRRAATGSRRRTSCAGSSSALRTSKRRWRWPGSSGRSTSIASISRRWPPIATRRRSTAPRSGASSRSPSCARRRRRRPIRRRWWRRCAALGARCTDIRLAHGYRALAALRDEVTTGAGGPELYLDAGRLEQADPLVAQGIVRTLAAVADEQFGGRTLPEALVHSADVCSNAPVKTLNLYEAAIRLDRAARAEAMSVYEQASRFIPDFLPLLRGRRRLAVAAGDWSNAATLLAREAELAADRGDRIRSLMTAAAITLEKLNDRQGALRHYSRLLELEPSHEEAFVRARALLDEQKNDAGLLELVVARAAATANVRERATMLKLQAELHRDRMKDSRSAVAALKQALALAPDDLDAYLMLAPLEEEQRWWQGAADCYRKIAELTPGSDTSRSARLREAAIREDELGDREAARNILEELIIDDTDRQAARQMAQLCGRMGKHARARELYLGAAESGTVPERIEDLLAAARVPVDNVTDEVGERATAEAFQLATTQKDGVEALVRVYEQLRRLERVHSQRRAHLRGDSSRRRRGGAAPGAGVDLLRSHEPARSGGGAADRRRARWRRTTRR